MPTYLGHRLGSLVNIVGRAHVIIENEQEIPS